MKISIRDKCFGGARILAGARFYGKTGLGMLGPVPSTST